jgi:hypothetical protein
LSRIAEWLAARLSAEDRDAVLGDLAEAGSDPGRAVRELLGLIARRQLLLWKTLQPWIASVPMHPFVLGELTCGNLGKSEITLELLNERPAAIDAKHDEVLRMLEAAKLWESGIGWVDMLLIGSSLLSNCAFWTRDQRLAKAPIRAGVRPFASRGKPLTLPLSSSGTVTPLTTL